jgi:hypothetical protein
MDLDLTQHRIAGSPITELEKRLNQYRDRYLQQTSRFKRWWYRRQWLGQRRLRRLVRYYRGTEALMKLRTTARSTDMQAFGAQHDYVTRLLTSRWTHPRIRIRTSKLRRFMYRHYLALSQRPERQQRQYVSRFKQQLDACTARYVELLNQGELDPVELKLKLMQEVTQHYEQALRTIPESFNQKEVSQQLTKAFNANQMGVLPLFEGVVNRPGDRLRHFAPRLTSCCSVGGKAVVIKRRYKNASVIMRRCKRNWRGACC